MKSRFILSFIIISFLLTGCNKNEPNTRDIKDIMNDTMVLNINSGDINEIANMEFEKVEKEIINNNVAKTIADDIAFDSNFVVVDSGKDNDYSYARLDSNNARNGGEKDISAAIITIESHIIPTSYNKNMEEKVGDIDAALKSSTLPFAIRTWEYDFNDNEKNIIKKALAYFNATDYDMNALIYDNDLDKSFIAVNTTGQTFLKIDFHEVGAGDIKITMDKFDSVENDNVILNIPNGFISDDLSKVEFIFENDGGKDAKNIKTTLYIKDSDKIIDEGEISVEKGEKKGKIISLKDFIKNKNDYSSLTLILKADYEDTHIEKEVFWYKDEEVAFNSFTDNIFNSTGIEFSFNKINNVKDDKFIPESEVYYKLPSGIWNIEGEGYDNSFMRFNPYKNEIYTGALASGTKLNVGEHEIYLFGGRDITDNKITLIKE